MGARPARIDLAGDEMGAQPARIDLAGGNNFCGGWRSESSRKTIL
jgi:hypothetical protein